MHIFKKWQDQHPSPQSRIAALIIGAAIFPALIPVLLLTVMPMADRALGFDSFFHGWANVAAGTRRSAMASRHINSNILQDQFIRIGK